MAVLSVMAIAGDPDDLIARMEATIDPVAARKAPQYGAISSTVVRTDNGIKIFNLWETEDGRHRMAEDPELQAAIREAGFPAPAFKAHEVLVIRSAGQAAKALSRRKGYLDGRGEPREASSLTQREREVTQLLAEGRSNKEVANTLGISIRTAETHRTNIMHKLGCHSVSDLVRYAIRNRIITP